MKSNTIVLLLNVMVLAGIAQEGKSTGETSLDKETQVRSNIAQIRTSAKKQPAKALTLFQETVHQYPELLSGHDIALLASDIGKATVFSHTFFSRQLAEKGIDIIRKEKITDASLSADLYHTLGYSYLAQGVFGKAIPHFSRCLDYTFQQDSMDYGKLQKAYSNLATAYNFMRKADSALKYSNKALAISRKHDSTNAMALAVNYGNLSRALTLTGKIDSAITLRKKALEINKKFFGPKGHKTATSYYYLGNLYSMKGDFDKALDYTQKCMIANFPEENLDRPSNYLPPIIGKNRNVNGVLQALMLKINFYETLYAKEKEKKWLDIALNHYRAVDTLVNILQQSQSEEHLSQLIAINSAGYESAANLIYKLSNADKEKDYDEELYSFASATKGKLLSYQMYKLEKASDTTLSSEMNSTRLDKALRDLQDEIQVASAAQKDSLELQALAVKAGLIGMKQTSRKKAEGQVAINLDRFKIKLSQVRALLEKDEAVLEYTETGDFLTVFCSTSSETIIKRIKKDKDYHSAYNAFMRSIKTGGMKDESKLSDYLIAPVYNRLAQKEHIVVLPTNKLHNLPFEALNAPGKDHALVYDHAISYHYSAKLWAEARKHKKPETPEIALFAPGFEDKTLAQLAEGNVYRGDGLLMEEGILKGERQQLVALPESLNEVTEIANMFIENGVSPYKVTGKDATEASFRLMPGTDIVHIATHGVSSRNALGQSGLFFSQANTQASVSHSSDGFLFVNELFSMEMSSDLVVLSACKSGTGKILKGEGVFALPRGFIFAGVPNLVASLWKVHDKKTKELITAFYEHILDGKDYARALQLSKIKMIEKGELPIDWSGVVLIGR